ncbi:hypothetical protein DFJ73DRAFT_89427 [Zopfochytrium polystomum]|nr:hypothetical protein DFJ73DRAFT_100281 [Zopfochytrium polystomum]KAI9330468.1 hypothetical protein DFJ73DRAFT_89427 [Zopfochytrium polystomum]
MRSPGVHTAGCTSTTTASCGDAAPGTATEAVSAAAAAPASAAATRVSASSAETCGTGTSYERATVSRSLLAATLALASNAVAVRAYETLVAVAPCRLAWRSTLGGSCAMERGKQKDAVNSSFGACFNRIGDRSVEGSHKGGDQRALQTTYQCDGSARFDGNKLCHLHC